MENFVSISARTNPYSIQLLYRCVILLIGAGQSSSYRYSSPCDHLTVIALTVVKTCCYHRGSRTPEKRFFWGWVQGLIWNIPFCEPVLFEIDQLSWILIINFEIRLNFLLLHTKDTPEAPFFVRGFLRRKGLAILVNFHLPWSFFSPFFSPLHCDCGRWFLDHHVSREAC